jgi:hypothetical protein
MKRCALQRVPLLSALVDLFVALCPPSKDGICVCRFVDPELPIVAGSCVRDIYMGI